MKINIDCRGFDNEYEEKLFYAEARKAHVKIVYHDETYHDSMDIEGDEPNVKKFVEDHFQATPEFHPYDELVNGYICISILKR